MAKGVTISITLPEPICDFYSDLATKLSTSRSKIIVGVLMEDYLQKTGTKREIECRHIDGTYCGRYENECNADPEKPEECPSYSKK